MSLDAWPKLPDEILTILNKDVFVVGKGKEGGSYPYLKKESGIRIAPNGPIEVRHDIGIANSDFTTHFVDDANNGLLSPNTLIVSAQSPIRYLGRKAVEQPRPKPKRFGVIGTLLGANREPQSRPEPEAWKEYVTIGDLVSGAEDPEAQAGLVSVHIDEMPAIFFPQEGKKFLSANVIVPASLVEDVVGGMTSPAAVLHYLAELTDDKGVKAFEQHREGGDLISYELYFKKLAVEINKKAELGSVAMQPLKMDSHNARAWAWQMPTPTLEP